MSFGNLFKEAKNSLKGKYVIACVVVFIYLVVSEGINIVDNIMMTKNIINGTFLKTDTSQPFLPILLTTLFQAILIVGYTTAMLNIAKGKKIKLGDLLTNWRFGFKAICLILVESIYVLLWSLLFVVPGIIKAYSYAMALYILVEDPSKSINKCISESQDMMNGYKMYYFVLQCGFGVIGVVITLVTAITIIMLNSMAITIPALCVMGLALILLITLNEVACAHFYLKILSKQTYSEIYGGNSIKDIQDKENSANLI